MSNKREISEFQELLYNLNNVISDIIPSNKDIDRIVNKLDNNIDLDFYDMLVLHRIRLIKHILDNSKK